MRLSGLKICLLGVATVATSTTGHADAISPGRSSTAVDRRFEINAEAEPSKDRGLGLQYDATPSNIPASGDKAWRSTTRRDLSAAADIIRAEYISAVYPNPDAFAKRLANAVEQGRREASIVSTQGGYAATLRHFVNSMDDAHVSLALTLPPAARQWPGFALRYEGGAYVIGASRSDRVRDGMVVTACDNRPIQDWIGRITPYSGGHPGLKSTEALAAQSLFVDEGNPFVSRPSRCIIEGRDVALVWQPLSDAEFVGRVKPLRGVRDRTVAISPFGADGAWVRLGNFDPRNEAEATAFKSVVAEAPSLRDKSIVVLDVRQNGGGPYDWMMAFLRAFYGQTYADRYARARLAIRPVFRATPEVLADFRADDAEQRKLGVVADQATASDDTAGVADALAHGRPLYVPKQAADVPMPGGPAPRNPVRARVLVLTDLGCGSVCIGFVDELKRFPGVEQVGTDTYVDNRTGTPLSLPLPSGNGNIGVPVMTRDGRARGDNVPQHPDRVFRGDIEDTAAVRAWITSLPPARG